MQRIIDTFNERANAAQVANPPTREWVKNALARRGGGRCPVRLRRLSLDAIVLHGDRLADLFCEFPDDVVGIAPYEWCIGYQPPERTDRVNTVQALMKESQWVDEWGARWAHAAGGVGAIQIEHPLKDLDALDEYIEGRMPDPLAPGRLEEAARLLAPHKGRKYCIGMDVLGLLEVLRDIRGMQELFMDLHTDAARLERLVTAVAAFHTRLLCSWAGIGVDCVMFGDDWGMQTGLQISPGMWRELFKPHYQAMFREAHAAGIDVLFHSCGKVIDIVEDFVDVGVDILDPIQPGCMDPSELARRFGGRVSFSGAVDVQSLLVFGTPDEVRRKIRRLIDTLGPPFGNGLMIGPANAVTPDAPLENLRAMFEACHGQ